MQYFDNGSLFTVTCTRDDVDAFASKWPCFGARGPITFQFDKRSGDLVDVRGDTGADPSGVLALSHDAQAYGEARAPRFFFAEVTDTFGGEANYSWVRRYKIRASTLRGAVWKLSRAEGYALRFDGIRHNARGACVCAFVDSWEEANAERFNVREL